MVELLTDKSEVEGSSPLRAHIFSPHFFNFLWTTAIRLDYVKYRKKKNYWGDIMRYDKAHQAL